MFLLLQFEIYVDLDNKTESEFTLVGASEITKKYSNKLNEDLNYDFGLSTLKFRTMKPEVMVAFIQNIGRAYWLYPNIWDNKDPGGGYHFSEYADYPERWQRLSQKEMEEIFSMDLTALNERD